MANLYTNPNFRDGMSPPLSAQNMNNLANAAATNQTYDIAITASASAWSSSGTITITATGLTSVTEGVLLVAKGASTAQLNAAQMAHIIVTAQSSNSITLKANGTIPTINIPFVIRVMSSGLMNAGSVIGAITGGRYEIEQQITLTTSGWNSSNTQIVSVTGVTTSNRVEISPAPTTANYKAFVESFVVCTAQANGSLTFTCESIPSTNITVNVVIWG